MLIWFHELVSDLLVRNLSLSTLLAQNYPFVLLFDVTLEQLPLLKRMILSIVHLLPLKY
jgi:hypothetical protein